MDRRPSHARQGFPFSRFLIRASFPSRSGARLGIDFSAGRNCMPYSTKWSARRGLDLLGSGDRDGFWAINEQIYGDGRFDQMEYQIVDLTAVEAFDVSAEDMTVVPRPTKPPHAPIRASAWQWVANDDRSAGCRPSTAQ